MNDKYLNKLSKKAKSLVDKSDEERIKYIRQKKFITYDSAEKIISHMEYLLDEPKDSRMEAMLLVGSPNNGKTKIAERFIKNHTPIENDDPNVFVEEEGNLPILYIELPEGANTDLLHDEILISLDIPVRRESRALKKKQIRHYCDILNVKLIIIDEIHHILVKSLPKQKETMDGIKNLSNSLKIPFVLIGKKEALYAINTDDQLKSRFRTMPLKKWTHNEEFLVLINTLERYAPLKKESNVAKDRELTMAIFGLCDGLLGEITRIFQQLTIEAIKSGDEKITLKTLNSIKYKQLSDDKFDNLMDLI